MMSKEFDVPGAEQFHDVIFEDSFLEAVFLHGDLLTLRIEFALTPDHPHYAPRNEGEYHSYCQAIVEFHNVQYLDVLYLHIMPVIDGVAVTADLGSPNSIEIEHGRWTILADAVGLSFVCERMQVNYNPLYRD